MERNCDNITLYAKVRSMPAGSTPEESDAALLVGCRKGGAAVAKSSDDTPAVTEVIGVPIGK